MVNAVSSVSVCSFCLRRPSSHSVLSKSYRWTLPALSMLVGIAIPLMGFFLIFEKMHLTFEWLKTKTCNKLFSKNSLSFLSVRLALMPLSAQSLLLVSYVSFQTFFMSHKKTWIKKLFFFHFYSKIACYRHSLVYCFSFLNNISELLSVMHRAYPHCLS